MRTVPPLVVAFAVALTACSTCPLTPLAVDGHELDAALVTCDLDAVAKLHVPRAVLRSNPQVSSDPAFVAAIARSGSQGRLGSDGVRAALYALHAGEKPLGLYGLQAASMADADRLEGALREIWNHNAELGRARVHRQGDVLIVVWHDGVSSACWQAVNASLAERLARSSG
ncbi:MAG: hypothetical protein KDE27_32850 [Planctomycetes bacterium]|nr:hypothetical protein [Planctomycetota bacterium]